MGIWGKSLTWAKTKTKKKNGADTGDSRSAALTARLRELPGEADPLPFVADLSAALHPGGPYGDSTTAVARLLCECGAITALVKLLDPQCAPGSGAQRSGWDLVPHAAANAVRGLASLDDGLAAALFDAGAFHALLALVTGRGGTSAEAHAACCALGVLAVSAAPRIRGGALAANAGGSSLPPMPSPWRALLDLSEYRYARLLSEANGGRGEAQVELIKPGGTMDDVVAYAPRFEAMVRESAVQTIASLAVAIADVDRERLALVEAPVCERLVARLLALAAEPVPEAHPNSSIRYQAALTLSCLCHVPPQLDPFADTPARRIALRLHGLGVTDGLTAALRHAVSTGLTSPGDAVLGALPKDAPEQLSKEIELRHIDTVLFLTDCFANLSSFDDLAAAMAAGGRCLGALRAILAGNAALFGGDAERIEQADAHFKTVGCTTRGLAFHVTHFAPSAHYSAAIALANVAEYGHSERGGEGVTALRTRAAQICKDCGNELFKLGDFESALWRYTKAARLHPGDDDKLAVFFSNRAECYLQMLLYPEAATDADTALEINPAHAKSQSRRERALEGMREDELRRAQAGREGVSLGDPPTGAAAVPQPSRS
jgi:tetratricopeptide (TPR) repeat protein